MTAAVLGGLLLVALLLAGCGEGEVENLPEATPTASPEPSSLTDLERYHYTATLSLKGSKPDGSPNEVSVTTEGDYEKPDRHSFTYTTQLPGAATRQSAVVIGEQMWFRNGDDPWTLAMPDDPQAERLLSVTFSPINPGFLGGEEFRQARDSVQRLPGILEFVNELRAYHYIVGPEGMEYFQDFLVTEPVTLDLQDQRWDVWLAQDGAWPVRIQTTGTVRNDIPILQQLDFKAPTEWTLRIDISRPNDPALTVQAPA